MPRFVRFQNTTISHPPTEKLLGISMFNAVNIRAPSVRVYKDVLDLTKTLQDEAAVELRAWLSLSWNPSRWLARARTMVQK